MADPFFTKENCDRCHNKIQAGRIQSWFTKDVICMECSAKESELKMNLRKAGDNKSYEGCGYIPKLPIDIFKSPEEQGCVVCPNCNGYGSSLKENSARCSKCGGIGLVRKEDAQ